MRIHVSVKTWHATLKTLQTNLILMCSLKHGALIPTGEEQFLGPYQPGECDKGGVV